MNREIDFTSVPILAGTYKAISLAPLGTAPSTIAISSPTQVQFQIPTAANLMNLSKTRFQLTATVAAATAFTFIHTHITPIVYAQLSTINNSSQLLQIPDFASYAATVYPITTKLDKMRGAPRADQASLYGTAGGVPLFPAQVLFASGTDEGYTTPGAAEQAPNVPYSYPQSLVAAASPASAYVKWDVSFKDLFPHTLLAEDKDIPWPTDLMLTLNLASGVQIGFAAADVKQATAAATAATGTWSGCNLVYYVQTNEYIVRQLQGRMVSSGIDLYIQEPVMQPYTSQFTAAMTSWQQPISIQSGMGSHLLRLYISNFVNDDGKSLWRNGNNFAAATTSDRIGALWDSLQVTFNSGIPQQNSPANLTELYNYMLPSLKKWDSVCAQGGALWQQLGSVVCLDFCNGADLADGSTPLSGKAVVDPQYSQLGLNINILEQKTQTTYIVSPYVTAIMLRKLVIRGGPGGIVASVVTAA